jgi:hypothetical protein
MIMLHINVATDFHPRPFGRTADHDPDANGAKFRDDNLVPAISEALATGGKVKVDFAGIGAVAPSFIEEAFGGLIERGFTYDQLVTVLTVSFPHNPAREQMVWDKIRIAAGLPDSVH